jgi:hypothetical protein
MIFLRSWTDSGPASDQIDFHVAFTDLREVLFGDELDRFLGD